MQRMYPFAKELLSRSLDSALASMSTSLLALMSGVAYGIYRLFITHRNDGWAGVKKNLATDGLHAIVFGVCWWVLLFSYHVFWKIPTEIRAEANTAQPPLPRLPAALAVPPFAYLHTKIPRLPPDAPTWTDTSPEPKTISALFTQDFPTIMKMSDDSIAIEWKDTGGVLHLKRQLYLDVPAKKKFVGFYIPSSAPDLTRTPEVCLKLAKAGAVQQAIDSLSRSSPILFLSGPMAGKSSGSLTFSGRVLLYYDDLLSLSQKTTIVKAFAALHDRVEFMGPDYLQKRISVWQRRHNAKQSMQGKPSRKRRIT